MVLASNAGISLVELSFRWLVSRPIVDAVIVGASRLEHLESNLRAMSAGPLDEETLKGCETVWQQIRGGHFQYNR